MTIPGVGSIVATAIVALAPAPETPPGGLPTAGDDHTRSDLPRMTATASLEPPLLAFSPTRRLASEPLGTALLLTIVVGSGIMAERSRAPRPWPPAVRPRRFSSIVSAVPTPSPRKTDRSQELRSAVHPRLSPAAPLPGRTQRRIRLGCAVCRPKLCSRHATFRKRRKRRCMALHFSSSGYGPTPPSAMKASICAVRTGRGTDPVASTASWKARMLKRSPSAASAFWRPLRIASSPR